MASLLLAACGWGRRAAPGGPRARQCTALVRVLVAALAVLLAPAVAPPPVLSAPEVAARVTYATGDLLYVAGDPKIHLVVDGRRRWIADTRSLQALDPDFSRLRQVTFEELDALPPGKPYRRLPVIRDQASGRIYLLAQETADPAPSRHWIHDLDTFSKLGFDWTDVDLTWPIAPDRYRDGPALTYRPPNAGVVDWVYDGETLRAVPAWRLQTEDERLYLALALSLTYNQEWRDKLAPRLAHAGTWIEWGDLTEFVGGRYLDGLNRITINRSLQAETAGVVASVLSHEVLHAVTTHGTGPAACYAEEVAAFEIGAATWAGLSARWKSRTLWGRSLDALVAAWRAGSIERFVIAEPAYQMQCGNL